MKVENIPGENKPYTHLNINNDPDKFHFVVVTDNTGASRPGIWPKGVGKINLMQAVLYYHYYSHLILNVFEKYLTDI